MSELKTQVTDNSVDSFIDGIADSMKRQDCQLLLDLFTEATGEQPKMWGSSIVGFGQYHYKSERSKQEGDWMITGFSPRKQNLTLYVINGFDDYKPLLKKLGKHKTSVGCLYMNKLSDVNVRVLQQIISASYSSMKIIHNVT